MNNDSLAGRIEKAFEDGNYAGGVEGMRAVTETLELLDKGKVRVAEPGPDGWVQFPWVRKAVVLFFRQTEAVTITAPPFEYRDKVPLKRDLEEQGIRVVPPGTIRYGAFLEPGVVVMPSYVNVGAYVGSGSMIDTWATVGSCAQVGRRGHVSGGGGLSATLGGVRRHKAASLAIAATLLLCGVAAVAVNINSRRMEAEAASLAAKDESRLDHMRAREAEAAEETDSG